MRKATVSTFKMTDGRTIHLDATCVESVTDYGEAMSLLEMKSGVKHTVTGNAADVLAKILDAAKGA